MICIECVTPEPLKKLFDTHGQEGDCQYCQRHGKAIESRVLFEYVYDRVRENLAQRDDLSHFELGMLYECGSDKIAMAGIDEVLSERMKLGEERYFDLLVDGVPEEFVADDDGHEVHFFDDDGTLEKNVYDEEWDAFVSGVQYTHRFFNANAKEFLDSVFSPLVTNDDALKPEVIRTMAHGDLLYRARYVKEFGDADKIIKDPAGQFGPTPRFLASSQRMTPNGISALYCALERETCLSEIRSITGDNVVSAALTPVAELKLLDLTVLDRVEPPELSLLDVGYREALHRKVFLDSLVKKMSRPKARNDELSYLSTQVVFEYLRLRFGKQVDGLVFPSVQTGEAGTNVVLFPEASRLAYILPAGAEKDRFSDEPAPVQVPIDKGSRLKPPTKVMVVHDSVRFHKVTAIETRAREYHHICDLFMSDETRRRLNLN
ncbi:RES family NAD+ phosphorylase [Pseudomonas aeruginosa]|uniref:RES family NAD+ phosphorylase n=1 Tax=Pseudomonas aeruginosa TaxID=287 RepID=UPI0009410E25|nr:RES family NAD+ phosphorylase [Pseudomonas aeruginosa]MCO3840186.1 RES domain-containing protein [Pseudomonas aeruginosa]NPW39362.1 RES family NAD+ phosphorylase [Pseudomonas aeruginosa]HBP1183242.1 RES family NAD+ phosphorylase [Pseudomonas aeruginosa]HCL4172874.1 RES family NAD+ phosphorylase [Pseudomonas aeruginosa]HEP8174145.1 RES family NAD+ phosphorylase [Pseudomonas aeruginosa]